MPGKSRKGGGLTSTPIYNKKGPFKMKGHTLPGIIQRIGASGKKAVKSTLGNPEGGGSPDMDFATKKSMKKDFDFKSNKPKNRPDWSFTKKSPVENYKKGYYGA